MKKGERYTATIEYVDFPNKGVAHIDNNTCVIKNTVPGQKVEFIVSKKRGDRIEGRLIDIIEPSADEIDSPCPHFGICGGCVYMNLEYEKQLKLKEEQVYKLLSNALTGQKEEWFFEGATASPRPYEYRNKMEFSFGDSYKGGPIALGMHKRGSFYDVETVDSCKLVDEDFRKILSLTKEYFKELPFFHKITHTGFLRHLLVRKAVKSGQILVALVTSSLYPEGINDDFIDGWKEKLLSAEYLNNDICIADGKMNGILHIINDSPADVVKADKIRVLYGQESIRENLLGLDFEVSTFSFFQTNSLGAESLYSKVREYIGDLSEGGEKNATVFDLYSGTGTIAQLMAPIAKKVIGVEIVEEAVLTARDNAKINKLDNCEFIAGDVLKVLDEISEKPDFIILDPPRDGVHPKALRKIIDYGVERLIYISCKPTSLTRDLEMFLGNDYVVERACCVDMFPFTANIETIVLLEKK